MEQEMKELLQVCLFPKTHYKIQQIQEADVLENLVDFETEIPP